jgi:hypothetical protein
MDYLAEVEERIKRKIEQIEEEMDNTSEVGSLKVICTI